MKKISSYLIVSIACILFAIPSFGKNNVKDSIKTSIKSSIAINDSLKAEINLPEAIVKKLTNQEIIEIIKYKEELKHNKEIALINSEEPPALVISIVFGSFVLLLLIPYYYKMRRTKSLHLLMNNLIEKGHEIPKELIFPSKKTVRSDFHKGIIFITFGLSLCIVLLFTKAENNFWTIGLIPMLVGAGYLISNKYNNSGSSKTENK